ncbi:hypothetical protein GCM10020001_107950 [Nonomuraea salmonea]
MLERVLAGERGEGGDALALGDHLLGPLPERVGGGTFPPLEDEVARRAARRREIQGGLSPVLVRDGQRGLARLAGLRPQLPGRQQRDERVAPGGQAGPPRRA